MPCHVVGGVRCQVDHCSLQVCHLSQSTSRDIWQPALHQRPQTLRVDERGVNNPPEKRDGREREKKHTHTMKSEGITAQSQEWQRCFRATTLVTKINPIILWRKGMVWHLWWCLLWDCWHVSGRAHGCEGTSGIMCTKPLVNYFLYAFIFLIEL